MKRYFSFANIVFALALTVFIIGFSAFSQKQKGSKYSFRKEKLSGDGDTTSPRKRSRNVESWQVDQLERQMKHLEVELKDLENRLKNQKMELYGAEADKAIKEVDFEKINEQVEKAIKNIDAQEINRNLKESLKDINKIELVEVKKELEQVKANLQKQKVDIKINTDDIRLNIDNAIKNAKKSIEEAKENIKNSGAFTDLLEKDGLIEKSKPYKIEVKNGRLYINNKKQSKKISDKYQRFYKKSDFTIDTSEGEEVRI